MTESEQKSIWQNLSCMIDEDRQNYNDVEIEKIREEFLTWDRFKQEQVETLFEAKAYKKYMEKGKM